MRPDRSSNMHRGASAVFAAAFAAANEPIASTSSNQNNNNNNQRPSSAVLSDESARSGSARMYNPARGNGSWRDGGRGRDEVGMHDVGKTNQDQGGRTKQTTRIGHHKGPYSMGESPTKPNRSSNSHRGASERNISTALVNDISTLRNSVPASSWSAPPPPSAIELGALRLFLVSRYSEVDNMLNLEHMADDIALQEAGLILPGGKGASPDVAGVMWKLAGSLFPNVVSLSLANNNLTNIRSLSPFLLTSYLPNVVNASFASNEISNIKGMNLLSPIMGGNGLGGPDGTPGWAHLRDLVLDGNPLTGKGAAEANYRYEIARRFPSLQQLDNQAINAATTISVPRAKGKSSSSSAVPKIVRAPNIFPVRIARGFFETEGARDFVAGFLTKFFTAYDTARSSLLAVYAPSCTFSYAADRTTVVRSRSAASESGPHQRSLDWKLYMGESNRNLAKITLPAKRVTSLKITPSDVVATLGELPDTVHPLDDPSKFVFDTWTMPGFLAPIAAGVEGETVLFAIVHGEFTEHPSKGILSFDRTFVLAPAARGTAANEAGWPCVILSDSLTIRAHSDPKAWAIPEAPPLRSC